MADADRNISGGFLRDFNVDTKFRVDNTLESLIDFFLDVVAMYDRSLTVDKIKEDMGCALLGEESAGKLTTVWDN